MNTFNKISVAVVVPVYRDVALTLKCIKSAIPDLLGNPGNRLIVIHDKGPESDMLPALKSLQSTYNNLIEVVENSLNVGFVKSVNRALSMIASEDVVLLNSDVILPPGWLTRLQHDCYGEERIGTATPMTNNGTICSFPKNLSENELLWGLSVEQIDKGFSKVKLPVIEAPTGVGFCMYIRNACFHDVGKLDEESFGRGYGEENDFCQRAIKQGWKNVISPNVFAHHVGSVSFSTEKSSLIKNAMEKLAKLHPNYHSDVAQFIQNNPLKITRIRRLAELVSLQRRPVVVHVCHELGGGVKQHIDELTSALIGHATSILIQPCRGADRVAVTFSDLSEGDQLQFEVQSEYSSLLELLRAFCVGMIHFHHTHGLHPKIWSLPSDLKIPYCATAHDYYWINANPTLTDTDGVARLARIDDDSVVNPLYPLPNGVTASEWRDSLRALLEGADFVIFPSAFTARIYAKFYEFKKIYIVWHLDDARKPINADIETAPTKHAQINVGVLGALGKEKGADLLEYFAQSSASHSLKFILVGYAYRSLSGVEATGPYSDVDCQEIIKEKDVHIFVFPARWPETFSYTLSHAIATNLPIFAPRTGAFIERLSGRRNTYLFDHEKDTSDIFTEFLSFIEKFRRGETIYSERYENFERVDSNNFYFNIYTEYLKNAAPPIESVLFWDYANKMAPVNTSDDWKMDVLKVLWRVTHSKFGSVLAGFLPYRFKRWIKRSLSSMPIHQIK